MMSENFHLPQEKKTATLGSYVSGQEWKNSVTLGGFLQALFTVLC
jgi:hypothetical protein